MPIPDVGCWLWDGATNAKGYGIASGGLAHRAAYEAFVGQVPDGMYVLHKCDVRCCVNPAHLFVGTQQDNMTDAANKGRMKGPTDRQGERHPLAKLTYLDVQNIRFLYKWDEQSTQKDLAAIYHVSRGQIGRIVRGERWT